MDLGGLFARLAEVRHRLLDLGLEHHPLRLQEVDLLEGTVALVLRHTQRELQGRAGPLGVLVEKPEPPHLGLVLLHLATKTYKRVSQSPTQRSEKIATTYRRP